MGRGTVKNNIKVGGQLSRCSLLSLGAGDRHAD